MKHATLVGRKLLLVQPYLVDNETPDGDPVLAVDGVGAGRGETVMITSDGRFARELLKTDATPVRWTIIGIKD
jgi:ethanolamine utilization protein EutN